MLLKFVTYRVIIQMQKTKGAFGSQVGLELDLNLGKVWKIWGKSMREKIYYYV